MKELDLDELIEKLKDFSDEMDYVIENPEDSKGKAEFFDRPYMQVIEAIEQLISRAETEARIDELEKMLGNAYEHSITDLEMVSHQTNGQIDFVEAVETEHIQRRIIELKTIDELTEVTDMQLKDVKARTGHIKASSRLNSKRDEDA